MSTIGTVKCASSGQQQKQRQQLSQIIITASSRSKSTQSNNEMTTRTRRRMIELPLATAAASSRRHRLTSQLQVQAVPLASYWLGLAAALALLALYHPNHHPNNQRYLQVSAFPSGAPDSACKDLKPGHGAEPASGAAPYELTQDKLQVEAGDQIKVTLSSPSGTNFKGLIVQASNEKGEPAKGKFLSGTGLKTLDSCSAVTHSDKNAKKTATLVWEASSELKSKEAFTFKATVVQKFDEFYMNIKSTLATTR